MGEGDDRARLERLAARENVSEMVEFKGRLSREELIEAYRACDVYAMPSYVSTRADGTWTGEGFGLTYIEAAACETPVIACETGGQTDAMIDGKTGLLVEPTVEAVTNALLELLSNPRTARRMGKAGRAYVSERFGKESYREKWAKLLVQSDK